MDLFQKYEKLAPLYKDEIKTIEKKQGADETLEPYYHRRLSSALIKEIHQYFFREKKSFGVGEFRYGCSVIEGENNRLLAPLAWQIPFRMDDLCSFYNEKEDLLALALFHREFLRLLPFRDETEEMGLIVCALLLQKAGYGQWTLSYLSLIWNHRRSQGKDLFSLAVSSSEENWVQVYMGMLQKNK